MSLPGFSLQKLQFNYEIYQIIYKNNGELCISRWGKGKGKINSSI